MQEVFDPPEMERETETEFDTCTSIRKDVVFEQDPGSSYRLWGNMKFEEDGHLLSQAKRDLLRVVIIKHGLRSPTMLLTLDHMHILRIICHWEENVIGRSHTFLLQAVLGKTLPH